MCAPVDVTNFAVFELSNFRCNQMLHWFSLVLELTVNGELNSVSNRGFKRIFIHLKTDIHIEVDTNGMTVQQGQTRERHNGEHHMTLDR